MSTEELAREFAGLCGWPVTEDYGDGTSVPIEVQKRYGPIATWVEIPGHEPARDLLVYTLYGWAGIGIVVEEMARRGFVWEITRREDGVLASFYEPDAWDLERPALGSELAQQPLDAVLAAAIAALRAEGGES